MELNWATPQVRAVLELSESGERPLDLVAPRRVTPPEAVALLDSAVAEEWFPGGRSPRGALCGLWLYFGGYDRAHELAQDLDTVEGSYWHALVHRLEPDAWNSGYWFRRAGRHAVFEPLLERAWEIARRNPECGFEPGVRWDPERFTAYCEQVRGHAGTAAASAAREMVLAEWQLLFRWCGMRP